jgi:hypothetical protein
MLTNRLYDVVASLISNATPLLKMRGHPELENWTDRLRELGRLPELAGLRKLLDAIAADGLTNPDLLVQQHESIAADIGWEVYRHAAGVAESVGKEHPHTAFVLSLVALSGWGRALGDVWFLYTPEGGPRDGWEDIPHVCAMLCLQFELLYSARDLAQLAYEAVSTTEFAEELAANPHRERYRRLVGRISFKLENSVANLAYDLRASSAQTEPSFRAEFGAILWCLGLIPESQLFRSNAPTFVLPSLRLFKWAVRLSLDRIPHDPLTQYVWLEMKDRPPFSLREHPCLFPRINTVHYATVFERMNDYAPLIGDPGPSPLKFFAQALVMWFKGTLTKSLAKTCLTVMNDAFAILMPMRSSPVEWSLLVRMVSLAQLLSDEFNLPPVMRGQSGRVGVWRLLAVHPEVVKRNREIYPEWFGLYTTPSLPIFQLIELVFSGSAGPPTAEAGAIDDLFQILEDFRAGLRTYSLMVIPPVLTSKERGELTTLLGEEESLVRKLRNAYFSMILPQLPLYFLRFEMSGSVETMMRPFNEIWGAFTDSEGGRKLFLSTVDELVALLTKAAEIAPDYARLRLGRGVGYDSLVKVINSHVEQFG